jgi:hypothetical protein
MRVRSEMAARIRGAMARISGSAACTGVATERKLSAISSSAATASGSGTRIHPSL